MKKIEPPVASSNRNFWPLILSVITFILIVHIVPFLGVKKPNLVENRAPTSIPKFPSTWRELSDIPHRLDDFVENNFPIRSYIIASLNYIRYKSGYSGTKRVLVGQNGWLFYNGDYLSFGSGQYTKNPEDIKSWVNGFQQRATYLRRNGSSFYMLIAPIQETIYPENLPTWATPILGASSTDMFISAAQNAGITQIVNPSDALIEAKNSYAVYDEFDTHWTAYGSYIAYRELMNRIAVEHPEMQPLPLSSFQLSDTPIQLKPRNMANMLGIGDFVMKERSTFIQPGPIHDLEYIDFLSTRTDWTAPQVLHTNSKSGRSLLLLRDSFSRELLPLLKTHFTTIIAVHSQDGFFRPDLVEKFHPDVVILEIIEPSVRFVLQPIPELETR